MRLKRIVTERGGVKGPGHGKEPVGEGCQVFGGE